MRHARPNTVALTRSTIAARVFGIAALLALVTFVLVARATQAQTPTATGTPTATTTAEPGRRLELAPIESVEVQVLKSQPPQYQLAVQSGLPGGCAQFHSISAERSGTRVEVTVWNSMPVGNVPCTAIYGYKDSTLNLGSDFAAGTTYTVVVNQGADRPMTTTFTTAAAGGATPTATPTPAVPQPANTGTGGIAGGMEVDAMDALIGGSAMLAAILVLSVAVVRVPRRRG
jgi:hypothetical protein